MIGMQVGNGLATISACYSNKSQCITAELKSPTRTPYGVSKFLYSEVFLHLVTE